MTVVALPASVWGPTLWRPRLHAVAQEMTRLDGGKMGRRYWRTVLEKLERDMEALGATDAEINVELDRFYAALTNALVDQVHLDPLGAA